MLAVLLGGALGALARAGLTDLWAVAPAAWPWPTFLVNLAGSAVLGWLLAVPRRPAVHALLGTGFCGALTTFSGLQVETLTLAREGAARLAVAYPLTSLGLGLGLAVAGAAVARRGRGA